MGKEIQECILYHVNAHRAHHNKNSLFLKSDSCESAQKDAQYALENMLRGVPLGQCIHKNPWNDGYCHELNSAGYLLDSWDEHIQRMIWSILRADDGHRERMLDLEYDGSICNHSHMAAEIAHDNESKLTVLTIRLYKL